MRLQLCFAVLTVLLVGLVGALLVFLVARVSLRFAAILSPLAVVLSIGAGLYVGVQLMLIKDAQLILLLLAATAPVALLVGVSISIFTHRAIVASRAKEEAARLRREVAEGRRELISWLSHDLRTPLAGIKAMAEALEDSIVPEPAEYYRRIQQSADRTAAMASDLMAFASLQSGEREGALEPVCVSDVLSDLVGQLSPLAESRGLRFTFGEINSAACVFCEAGLLSRAMQNVLANAIHYSAAPDAACQAASEPAAAAAAGAAGSIRVSLVVTDAGDAVQLRVADSCGGLSVEERTRMFDVGWRSNAARTPGDYAGSGLGLPIVQAVAKSLDGDVWAQDVPGGCCVVLSLPLARA